MLLPSSPSPAPPDLAEVFRENVAYVYEVVESRRALRRLFAVLDTLDDDKRAVFVLFELEGMAMNDVAIAVGCPAQTAYARLYAARKIVRAAFGMEPEKERR